MPADSVEGTLGKFGSRTPMMKEELLFL